MLFLLGLGFIGWLTWVTATISNHGRTISELRQTMATLAMPRDRPAEPVAEAVQTTDGAIQADLKAEEAAAPEARPCLAPLPAVAVAVAEPLTPGEPNGPVEFAAAGPAAAEPAGPPEADGERVASTGIGGAEARVGTVWLSRIGVILLLAGAVLAYLYGVTTDQQRLAVGYAAGLVMLGLGFWGRRRRYGIWAQAMTGGGLGLLYLTTSAGSALFSPVIIPQPLGFMLMVATTILGTGLAVGHDSQALGLLSLVGGFATPFVLSTGGGGDLRLLFAYIAVLDAGLLLVAHYRNWRLYNYLVFVATWGIFGLWRVFRANPGDWGWATVAASAFFASFALVSVAHCLLRKLRSGPAELFLAVINGAVYFCAGLSLISPADHALRALFAFAVAAAFLALGVLTVRINRGDRLMVFAFLGQAVVYLTIAFPLALSGPWITAAWALQGALMVWLGFSSGYGGVRQAGLAVLGLAAARLVSCDTLPWQFGEPPLTQLMRAFTFATVVLACYAAAIAYSRRRGNRAVRDGLAGAASLFTLWYLTLEVCLRYRDIRPLGEALGSCGMTLAAVWAVYGLALALADGRFSYSALRTGARAVLGLALAAMTVANVRYDVPELMGYLGLVVAVAAAWLAEYCFRLRGVDRPANGGLSLAANALAFAGLAVQANQVLTVRLAPSVGGPLWPVAADAVFSLRIWVIVAVLAAYVLLAMAAGILLRSATARGTAALLSLVVTIAASYGAIHLQSAWPVRLLAFVLAVPGVYLAIRLAGRTPDRAPHWESTAALAAGLAAATLTAWWGACELLRSPHGQPGPLGWSRENLVLIWLGGYAAAVGAVGTLLRSRAARALATAMQWVALFLLLVVSTILTTPLTANTIALIIIVAGIYGANWLSRCRGADPGEARSRLAIGLAACLTTLAWAATAITRACDANHAAGVGWAAAMATRNHWVLIVSGVYGIAVMAAGRLLKSPATRMLGFLIQAGAIAGAMTAGLANLAAPPLLRLVAFAATVGGAHVISWWASRAASGASQSERRATELLSLTAAALTVAWLLVQANAWIAAASARDFGISASWGVYGLVVLVTGFVRRHRATRLLGMLVLALTLGKIGLIDVWQLAVSWRIWITVGLGVIFVAASLLYQRFSRIILADDHHSADV